MSHNEQQQRHSVPTTTTTSRDQRNHPTTSAQRFRFNDTADARLLEHVMRYEPYEASYGTRATCWDLVRDALSNVTESASILTSRACRDRFKILLARRPRQLNGFSTPSQEKISSLVRQIKKRMASISSTSVGSAEGLPASSASSSSLGVVPVRVPLSTTHKPRSSTEANHHNDHLSSSSTPVSIVHHHHHPPPPLASSSSSSLAPVVDSHESLLFPTLMQESQSPAQYLFNNCSSSSSQLNQVESRTLFIHPTNDSNDPGPPQERLRAGSKTGMSNIQLQQPPSSSRKDKKRKHYQQDELSMSSGNINPPHPIISTSTTTTTDEHSQSRSTSNNSSGLEDSDDTTEKERSSSDSRTTESQTKTSKKKKKTETGKTMDKLFYEVNNIHSLLRELLELEKTKNLEAPRHRRASSSSGSSSRRHHYHRGGGAGVSTKNHSHGHPTSSHGDPRANS